MIDPTPPFENPIQSTWDPTQEFYVGLLFADKDELQAAVKQYHIKRNQTFSVKESDPACWSVRCKNCYWCLRACFRATHKFFEVRKYNGPHTCTESTLTQDHEQLDIHIIEKELRDIVKDDPNIRISSLQQSLYNKYEYRPSYFKVWEAKHKAIGRAFGDWDKSYQLLPKWLKALTDSNPGNRVIWRMVPATVPGYGDKYLRELPVQKWTLAHDGGHHYGAMTTNLPESFNGVLKSARNLPITALVELTYYHCVAYFADRYTKARTEITASERITTYAKNKFNKWEKKVPKHSVTVFSHEDGLFEVRTPINPNSAYRGNHRHEVNLRESTCSCQKWQVYKIPCSHVIAVCKYQGISAMRYIDRCYCLEEQVACYAPRFRMVLDSVHWNEPDFSVLYPNVKLRRAKGQPRSTRLLNEMDLGTEHQPRPLCSLCRQEGHNRRTCPTRTVVGSTVAKLNDPT
ncbi:uncharacterized protein LOC142634930 [Castanea sativa]|uniref:uncharacterized protein LOC142634930 n=1 Tax=Castanea sativa TaxID=21020 RepID=UPI003F653EA5